MSAGQILGPSGQGDDRRILVVDIGGGSTEIVLGEREEALVARSLKLGAIRLTDRFFGPQLRGFDIRGIGPRIRRINYTADGSAL